MSDEAFAYDENGYGNTYGNTYVLMLPGKANEILGFYTLKASGIQVSKIIAVKAIIAFVDPEDNQAVGFYKSIGIEKATDIVQKEIEDSFNEKCDLYIASLDGIEF